MNQCEQCIRLQHFSKEICTHCGFQEFTVILDGASIFAKCSKCGFSYAGGSFFAPCETDQTEYRVRISGDIPSIRFIVEIGKLMNINALALKKAIDSGQIIDRTYRLREVMEIRKVLEEHGAVFFH